MSTSRGLLRCRRCTRRVASILAALLLSTGPFAGCAQESAPLDTAEVAREARRALQQGQYQEARPLFRSLLEAAETTHAPAYAETFLAVGAYEDGLREVTALLEERPEDPFLLHARGRLLEAVGRYEEAGEAFRQARGQQPDFWRNTLAVGALMEKTGQRSAGRVYREIYRAYEQQQLRTADALSVAGRAAAKLGEYHEANNAFRTAHEIDSAHVQTLYWWAELFREKYNEADARRTYEEALALNPHHAGVYVGYAQAGGSFDRQEELVRKALAANPYSVEAMSEQAKLSILSGAYGAAEATLRKALAVNPRSVQALAHLASVHYLRGDSAAYKTVEARALSVNARADEFYLTLAENCTHQHRYPSAAQFSAQAVSADRRSVAAYAAHGINLLRLGRAGLARRYLDASFDADPFNLFVGNTLTLIDEYAQFDTLETENVRVLVHRSESAVLGPAVRRLAQASYDSLSARYPYRPAGKIQVEAYHDADDFAVRVAGVPHLGLLGVSFGDVVAFQTPQAGADQPQNWARTLWHELAHTMAIGVSDYHVPRWFTEGLSVYEERRARPAWAREMDLELLAAFEQEKLLPLARIGEGFTRPEFPGQVMLSYYHASKIIALIAEQHGFEAVVEVLAALGEGRDLEASLQRATGQDLAALDEAFRASLRRERTRLVKAGVLPEAPVDSGGASLREPQGGPQETLFFRRLRAGQAALDSADYEAAEAAFTQALEQYAGYVGAGNPYEGLAAVYRARDETARRIDVLEQFLTVSDYGAEEARTLAELHQQAGHVEQAVRALERALEVEPHDRPAHTRLAALYEQQERYAEAAEARRAVLALGPVDEAEAYYRLARSLYQSRQLPAAKRAVLQALEQAPGYRAAQKLLLQCVAEG